MFYCAGIVAKQDEDTSLKAVVKKKYLQLKQNSGSHSPSAGTLQRSIPEINLKIDCCYLSNPYATEVFMSKLKKDLENEEWLHNTIESYPAQNRQIAQDLSRAIGVRAENIFIGNGATEIISGIITQFVRGKLLIMLPTFSPYHEYVNKETAIHYYPLQRDNDGFSVNKEHLLKYCRTNEINNIVIINPNNPDGSYIEREQLKSFLRELSFMDNVILDESFIDFAGDNESMTKDYYEYNNLTIIKSMSKDFGIAGIRAGYCITKASYVDALLEKGYLWNSSCFAIYFFQLLSDKDFITQYMGAKEKYSRILAAFSRDLMTSNPAIRFYRSKANFFLAEIIDPTKTVEELMLYLLVEHGIYIRACSDKKGLDDRFFRVSCRKEEDNALIINAIRTWK
jgi:histidinol-phosphate/aromatic aminotransferase/cobyric acid decarboxylase-like protein